MEYIEKADMNGDCIFCSARDDNEDDERYVLYRGARCFIILNRYPYTSGHLMVVPYRHLSEIEDLSAEEMSELMSLTRKSIAALKSAYSPQGFNIGINIGGVAGAGIKDHIHQHIVPRWGGDTNFMSVVSDVRVLPESLESTYGKLLELLTG
jgi:ATP adenylyltransferase